MVAQEFVCEVIDRTTPFSHQEDELFEVALKTLDNLRNDNIGCSVAWFLYHVLRIHGYPLHVDYCATCGKHIESDASFDVSLGSVVCRDCRTADCIAFPLTAVTAVKTFDNPCINECLPKKMVQGIIKLELRILCSRFDAKIGTSLHIQSLC
jgi:DNA repair protein RecO